MSLHYCLEIFLLISNWLLNTFSIVLISKLFKSPVFSTWPHLFIQQRSASPTWWKNSSTSKFILSVIFFTHQKTGVIWLFQKHPSFSGNKPDISLHVCHHLPLSSWARQFTWFLIFSSVKLMPWTRWILRPLSVLNQGFSHLMSNLCFSIPLGPFLFIQPIYVEYKWGIRYFLSANLLFPTWFFTP